MTIDSNCETLSASFRDPSGFIFKQNDILYRQVNAVYQEQYQKMIDSGLYTALVERKMLVSHEEVETPIADQATAWKTLKPSKIELISYPYEWSFSQLKDAALLTLEIQSTALEHGMTLKDASAYNIQFQNGRPVFLDTLSFESYNEGLPWVAYRQFCQHFLAPLAMMAKRDVRLIQLLRAQIDGMPLDLASKLLPRKSWFNYGLLTHLHLHARTQRAFSASHEAPSETTLKLSKVSKLGLEGILQGLRNTISKLDWKSGDTEWGDYYNDTNYSSDSFEIKKVLISSFLDEVSPRSVWDLGGNIGLFSRIASDRQIPTVSFDIDPTAVEINYRQIRKNKEQYLTPLILDLTNPTPGLGWNNIERDSLTQRGPVDCIMALALIHHLSIANNVPFPQVAAYFAELCSDSLIIEFVKKPDSQVQRLLRSRDDIFDKYDQENFQQSFSNYFQIIRAEKIESTERILYLMKKK